MSLKGNGLGMNGGQQDAYNESISNEANFYTGGYADMYESRYYDPLVTGYSFIIFTKLPTWVVQEYPGIKSMLEKNFQGFDGLADIEIQTGATTEGFSANERHTATNIAAKPSGFTLKHNEFSGSPIRKMYQHWVSGVRDPRTNCATLS